VLDSIPENNLPLTDLGDNVLMAGIVDPHVHINEPAEQNGKGLIPQPKRRLQAASLH